MKAELVKRQDRWDLYGEDGSKKASSAPNPMGKLSIENCESIANGYDLEQMSIEKYDTTYIPSMFINFEISCKREGFIEGCKAIIELIGDKKFSEDDVISMIEKSRKTGLTAEYIILTQQQTEWEVEVEQELIQSSIEGEAIWKTKLDADGCLILKRK